jgi:hypothetical protein
MDGRSILHEGILVHENNRWSPVGLCDSTHGDKVLFGNDMVTNVFDMNIMLCLVCYLYDLAVGTNNANRECHGQQGHHAL